MHRATIVQKQNKTDKNWARTNRYYALC